MKALGKALAFVMLLALVGAGTATAAKMITGADVANGTLTGSDIMNGTVKKKDLSDGAQASLQGAAGPAGRAGPAGPAGPEGPAGPAGKDGGPNRYAELTAAGVLQEDVKNIDQTQVSHPDAGRYCFTLPVGRPPDLGRRERPHQRHDRDAGHLADRRDPRLPRRRERPGAHVRPFARRLPGQRVPPDRLEQLGTQGPAAPRGGAFGCRPRR